MALTEFHSYPGSVRWRVTPAGCEVEGVPLELPGEAGLNRIRATVNRYKAEYAAASNEFKVPVELLMACSMTESVPDDPRTPTVDEQATCIRREPGYISDESTPNRVSAGFCQLLISTARQAMKNPAIDRKWLLDVGNNLRACAAYVKSQSGKTGFDPVLVACAYNAGGLYRNDGANNRWKLRQFPIGTSKHADRFVQYFNAAVRLVQEGLIDSPCYQIAEVLRGTDTVRPAQTV